uniref:DUF4220 domain-containing protein n=1 Tax=Arundo donax TaxID=35708 RepID=A0A0A9D6T8_ARUDO
MASGGTLLLLASICMFVAGLLKYGERIWALKCGNISSISSSFQKQAHLVMNSGDVLRKRTSEEEILLLAHYEFIVCKSVFIDSKLLWHVRHDLERGANTGYLEECIYRLVEMELSLMYDILYTKAAVIHTWYGFCIHIISLLGTATAFLLFLLSGRRGGYSRADVIISYVLLVGALVLDAISLCRALLSSWTCSFLYRRESKWLLHVVTSLRHRVLQPARRRLWPGSLGQYNLFHLCTRDKDELGSRLAMKMGLRDWWNKLHLGTFSSTNSFSTRDLKESVLQALGDIAVGTNFNSRGSFTLQKRGVYKGLAHWSVNIDFDDSIIVWHIATNLYIHISKAEHQEKLLEATKVLSNYMMFLLLVKPDMLPGRTRQDMYIEICNNLDLYDGSLGEEDTPSPRSWNPCRLLKELFHHEGPHDSRIQRRDELSQRLYKRYNDTRDSAKPDSSRKADVEHGALLGIELLNTKLPAGRDTLELILGVWVEMMLYAAEHCSRDSHARQLSNGGEFITIVWIVAHHFLYYFKN